MLDKNFNVNQNKRCRLFTEFHHEPSLTSSKKIINYNVYSEQLFGNKEKLKVANAFLTSGKLKVIIPTYEEHNLGAIYKVLAYFDKILGKENIFVIDADSKDKTAEHVKQLGYEVIKQSYIEKFIDLQRISQNFSIELPLRRGKGKTLFLSAIYQTVLNLTRRNQIEFNLFSDADIRNPNKFDYARYLAWVGTQHPKDNFLEIKSAQHNRNNQSVMNTMAILQATNPTIYAYYKVIREMIWPLTGQVMRATRFIHSASNALGYGIEIITNLASVDFMEAWDMKIAQIEIPTRCEDAENTESKETAMMVGISTLLYAMNEILFKKGIKLINMKPKDYKALNEYLNDLENYSSDGFCASVISNYTKPNAFVRIYLDRMLPSANYFIQNGYVDVANLANLSACSGLGE